MLYIFFAIACVFSNYMIASEKPFDTTQNKEYYDKLLDDQIKDPVERAKYNKGYVVQSFGIIPLEELQVMVGVEGCMVSLPYHQAVEIQAALDKNKKNVEDDIKLTATK